MNLSVIALAILAWKVLSDNQPQQKSQNQQKFAITDLLNDDCKTVLAGAEMLTNKSANTEDKMSAIISLMSNPTVMSLAQNLFQHKETAQPQEKAQTENAEQPFQNDEGYQFATPSTASQEFFRPIEKIADAEVKSKLYWFYDNWYL